MEKERNGEMTDTLVLQKSLMVFQECQLYPQVENQILTDSARYFSAQALAHLGDHSCSDYLKYVLSRLTLE